MATSYIRQILNGDPSVEELEKVVERGTQWLDLAKPLLSVKALQNGPQSPWSAQIQKIQGYGDRPRTVIGVVGNTGAGKSSVINAVLNEKQLLPTSAMRACTAVVTEVSYNLDEDHKYRAEIEFVDEGSWLSELSLVFAELIDASGKLVRDANGQDSEVGIAYDKIKAVYPEMTNEDVGESSPLIMLAKVAEILGSVKTVQHNDGIQFHKEVQKYVDSQDKVRLSVGASTKRTGPKERQLWPLIKVVRIFCKADALSTGAVLVDLPGVHDANAARSAVTDRYMQQCTALWIIAPIVRAVDDKAARHLLGKSFKQQLAMDGGLFQISFICSKIDDISMEETLKALEFGEDIEAKQEELFSTRTKLKILYQDLKHLNAQQTELEDNQSSPRGIIRAPTRDHTNATSSCGHKRQRMSLEKDDGHFSETIGQFDQRETVCNTSNTQLAKQIEDMGQDINSLEALERTLHSEVLSACIKGRTEYSKRAIQQDFAAGVQDMDQQDDGDEDGPTYDPDHSQTVRDYDEVGKSLPVFFVSSSGYQQLSKTVNFDKTEQRFISIEETGIPALREHCKQLTVNNRVHGCKRFLLALDTLHNSVGLWACSKDSLSIEHRQKVEASLAKNLSSLEHEVNQKIDNTTMKIRRMIDSGLKDNHDYVCSPAVEQAATTCGNWGSRPDGYKYFTYKAVCRRGGVFKSKAAGLINFNESLCNPMMDRMTRIWAPIFDRKLPAVLSALDFDVEDILEAFHEQMASITQLNGTDSGRATLSMLEHQIGNYKGTVTEAIRTTRAAIDEKQKEINRQFLPLVGTAMNSAYNGCTNESGPGCFERMKAIMLQHVSAKRSTMFKDACRTVHEEIESRVIKDSSEQLKIDANTIITKISLDYKTALSSGSLEQWQKEKRKDVLRLLEEMPKFMENAATREEGKSIDDSAMEDVVSSMEANSMDDSVMEEVRPSMEADPVEDARSKGLTRFIEIANEMRRLSRHRI